MALQPESAEFFVAILIVVMLFPLSTDPLQKVPVERRATWPILRWEWVIVRAGSFALSPIAWLAVLLLLRTGWRTSALVLVGVAFVQVLTYLSRRFARDQRNLWLHWIPAPPGAIGAIMRLQWREMLLTLDPYVAFTLVISTELYRASGRRLDPAAPQVLSLLVGLALSTETQVLLGVDGVGAERYRQLPVRGW